MTEQEQLDWLRLLLSENVGAITFRKLLAVFGSAAEALKNISEWAQKGGAKKQIKVADEKVAVYQLKQAQKSGVKLLFSCENNYPKMLKHITDYPPVLFIKGQTHLLEKECVALVGTRAATLNGKNFATHISKELAEQDYVIVSGLAKGIDKAAHIGALQSANGKGGTIAVLGTDINTCYPAENQDLYNEIETRGCLISEFPFKTMITPQNFPRRNRIISGLSQGVVVVEANLHSGSLITAKEALSQNREVFAVPGSPLDPRAAGPNALIQDGATLVTKTQDITDVLTHNASFHLTDAVLKTPYKLDNIPQEKELDAARTLILENLSPEMTEIDALIRETNLEPRIVHVILTQLELAGRIEHFTGNRIALIYGGKE